MVSSEEELQGSKTNMRELQGETEEYSVSLTRGHVFCLSGKSMISWPSGSGHVIICLLAPSLTSMPNASACPIERLIYQPSER